MARFNEVNLQIKRLFATPSSTSFDADVVDSISIDTRELDNSLLPQLVPAGRSFPKKLSLSWFAGFATSFAMFQLAAQRKPRRMISRGVSASRTSA